MCRREGPACERHDGRQQRRRGSSGASCVAGSLVLHLFLGEVDVRGALGEVHHFLHVPQGDFPLLAHEAVLQKAVDDQLPFRAGFGGGQDLGAFGEAQGRDARAVEAPRVEAQVAHQVPEPDVAGRAGGRTRERHQDVRH